MKRVAIVYEATRRCDASCPFCYNVWKAEGSGELDGATRELSTEEAKRAIDGIAAVREIASFAFAGGEPLLREDLPELVAHVASRGIPVLVATNGALLDRTMAAILSGRGVSQVDVSLHADDDETFGALCGRDGFSRAKGAILAAKEAGMRVVAACIVAAQNAARVADIAKLAFALGADAFAVSRFAPAGAGFASREAFAIDDATFSAALFSLEAFAGKTGFPVAVSAPAKPCVFDRAAFPSLEFGACPCGDGKWCVDPSGRLRVCEQSPETLGFLLESGFEELAGREAARRFLAEAEGRCGGCASFGECRGGCRFL